MSDDEERPARTGTMALVVYSLTRDEDGQIRSATMMMQGHAPVTLLPGDTFQAAYTLQREGLVETEPDSRMLEHINPVDLTNTPTLMVDG